MLIVAAMSLFLHPSSVQSQKTHIKKPQAHSDTSNSHLILHGFFLTFLNYTLYHFSLIVKILIPYLNSRGLTLQGSGVVGVTILEMTVCALAFWNVFLLQGLHFYHLRFICLTFEGFLNIRVLLSKFFRIIFQLRKMIPKEQSKKIGKKCRKI